MSKKFMRILCLAMAAVLVVGLLAGLLATVASAAATTYQLADLLAEGKIKPLGRTQTNRAGDGITAEWSGSGFDVNVSGSGGTMTLGYKSSYASYVAVLVDGAQIWRGQLASSAAGSLSVTIPSGAHTVRVVKETQLSSSATAYWYFTTLAFGGTVEAAPANKGLYIEFIGDSITCGDGALGEYEPGVKWLGAHDSATNVFAYYTAQKLGADYSLVARGGIGLFTGVSAEEGTTQKVGMQDIYNYVSGYNQDNGEYSFSRQPDVVIIELGANDSTGNTAALDRWDELINAFVDQVRSKNPNAHIVLHSTNAGKYGRLMKLVESRKASDPKLHTFYYAYLGNGSAALDTQFAGHPSADDHMHFAEALANFLRAQDIVPTYTATPSYTDITYYISENGNDSNAGTSADAPLLTLPKAFALANASSGSYSTKNRIVFKVSGAVVATNSQEFGGVKTSGIKNSEGGNVPVLITTKDYSASSDNRAELKIMNATTEDNAATIIATNDITFQNVLLKSYTAAEKPLSVRHFYAAGHHVVFDNTTFISSDGKKWQISVDHFTTACINICSSTPEAPLEASITFKNGDYTGLDHVSVIKKNEIFGGTASAPGLHSKLIIEDGAKMGTVYNRYGVLDVASAEVIINGGSVNQYVGTADGTSSARKTYKGDINLTVNGGNIYGTHFSTAGKYATIQGNINTTINGGIFEITPKDTGSQYDAYFFGGRQNCVVENINTTVTGGQLYLTCDVAKVDTAYYFGVSGGGTVKNVTNKISGGLFMPYARNATGSECNLYFGNHTGAITGTLRNEITGGDFQFGLAGISGRTINAGSRGVNLAIGKIENVFGKSGSTHGPNMSSATVRLAGSWAQVGTGSKLTAQPTACSDTVVVSNTVYGGNYSTLYMGSTGNPSLTDGYYSFVKGSIENNIYGGFFQNNVFAAGNGPVFGRVKTNIYGGFFKSVYGGTENKATVFDGVELNIYGMDEYYPAAPTDSWVICGGNKSEKVPVPQTSGRDAIKYTIAPAKANGLTLNTKLKVGDTDGTASVAVSGGAFPRGFAVTGKTVGQALASGCVVFDASTGKKASYSASDASVTGAVVVDKDAETFRNALAYYVSENGQDAYSGTSPVTPKKTLRAAFSEIITDNGGKSKFPVGTTITIYVEGSVNNDAGTGSQQLGGGQVLTMTDVHDHVPVTITTYNYNGSNKATIVDNHYAGNAGNASCYVVNDLYFKDIDLQSVTNPSTGYADTNFYAAGCAVTFDNCSITTDGKATAGDKAWKINADHFSTGGFNPLNASFLPLNGSVTFKNGDYTNLLRVSAVGADNIWRSTENGGSVYSIPEMYCSVIIEDGAKMGTVYNTYGTLAVGSATVEIRGGTVEAYIGTRDTVLDSQKRVVPYNTDLSVIVSGGTVKSYKGTGNGLLTYTKNSEEIVTGITAYDLPFNGDLSLTVTGGTIQAIDNTGKGLKDSYSYKDPEDAEKTISGSATAYVNIKGNVTSTFSGGTVGGVQFSGLNNYVKLTGDLTNNFTGGKLVIVPTDTTNNAGHGIFLAGRDNCTVTGNVVNNISGGELGVQITLASTQSGIWMGQRSGSRINGNLTNNVTGGEIWVRTAQGITAEYGDFHSGNFSGSNITGTLTNNFIGGTFEITRGGYYLGQQGVSGFTGKIVTVLGDQETGNGPTFKGSARTIHAAGNFGRIGVSANTGTYPETSVCTDNVVVSTTVYGGTYEGNLIATVASGSDTNVGYIVGSTDVNVYGGNFTNFYATGNAPIYGKATTNIYGGTFNAIYGARNGKVYDGVELNIYGMIEGENPTGIYVNGTGTIQTRTAGRDAVKLTIDPETALTLSMPISAKSGTIEGATSVLVTGGTYTKGFAVNGVTVKAALADGLVPLKDGDKTIVKVTSDMTTTGTDSVTLVTSEWTDETAEVTLSDTTVTYDGETDAKVPTTTVKFHKSELVKDTDYTVSYSRDGAATTDLNSLGQVTVVITAKAPYSGTLSASYTITRAGAVGEAIAAVTDAVSGYDANTVKSSDSADLTALTGDIQRILAENTDVLTDDEKQSLQGLLTTVDALEAKIAAVAKELKDSKTAADGYSADTVTADDSAELTSLAGKIAAIPDGNLTDTEKAEKKALADKVTALQKVITDTAAALAAVKAEADGIDGSTVTAEDSDELAALAAQIEAIPENQLTTAQKAEKKAAADKVAALQKVITDTASALAAAREAADKLDGNTVTSDDSDELAALAAQLDAIHAGNLTADQKREKQDLTTKVDTLQTILADTAADLKSLRDREAAFEIDKLTSADKAKLQALLQDLQQYPTDHLTPGEQELLEQLASGVENKLAVIAKAEQIAGDMGAIEALLAGKTTQNITSDNATDVQAAKKAIEELKKDTSLSDEDKAKLAQLETKADELIAQLEKADAADEIPAAVGDLKPETVVPGDKAALEAAIAKLEKAEADHGTNYTEAEKKAIEDAKAQLEAVLAVIEEVEAVQKQIADLPATAEPDDEKTIAALEAARAAYGELNERQKGMIADGELEKLDKLTASLKDYKITKGNKAEWTQKSGKDLSFTANGLLAKFQGIQVNGTTVDSKYYTAKSGSTVITLSDDFLDSLAKGEYAIKVVFTDGVAIGTFTVKEKAASPSTGDSANLALFGLLAVFSAAAAAALTVGVKKREQ